MIFGYWFKKDNFGIHMRNERNKNWKTTSRFNDKEYNFFIKEIFMDLEVMNLTQKTLR